MEDVCTTVPLFQRRPEALVIAKTVGTVKTY